MKHAGMVSEPFKQLSSLVCESQGAMTLFMRGVQQHGKECTVANVHKLKKLW